MPGDRSFNLATTYVRLRPDATVEPLPVDESFWQRLTAGQLGNFHHEYLVTSHLSEADWSHWEMHPNGDEVVVLLSGSVSFIFEIDQQQWAMHLDALGGYLIVGRGVWHTAKIHSPSRMLFITAGEGTLHRDRV